MPTKFLSPLFLLLALWLPLTYQQATLCTQSCLQLCQSPMLECLQQCECNKLLNQEDTLQDTQDIVIDKQSLMEVREAWITYKKEANKIKRYEKKIQKANKSYLEYQDKALKLLINPEESDMHCGITCINGQKSVVQILECMNSTCTMTFKQDLQEIIDKVKDDSESQLSSLDESDDVENLDLDDLEQDSAQCNSTCVDQCDIVKQVLEENYYVHCMKQRCGCQDFEIAQMNSQQGIFLQVEEVSQESTFSSTGFKKLQFALMIVACIAIIVSMVMGFIHIKFPEQKYEKREKKNKKKELKEKLNGEVKKTRNVLKKGFKVDEEYMSLEKSE